LVPALAATLALVALGACGDEVSGPEAAARVRVLLTDAPADYLASAEVCISRIYLQPSDDDEAEEASRVTLWEKAAEGQAQCIDLLTLPGITAGLTEAVEVPAGTYPQLRFVVESATVTLDAEYAFEDEATSRALKVPSGGQSGIKVQLLEPVFAEGATVTEITVDADVDKNFVIQGNPHTPAGIKGVIFTPHLVEIDRQTTAPGS
jgi:hypothetical protein